MSVDAGPGLTLRQQLVRRKPIKLQRGPHDGPDLKRSFGTFQLMMFGVGATVGTGIFFVLQEAVPDSGPAVIISFLVAGLGAGLSALCYAEVASAIPVSGSTYSYAYHALGELVAMVIAACVLLEYGVSSAAVAVGWSGYFNELLDNLFGFSLPDALSYSPIPYEDNTTGIINLPAVVLVMMCMVLLIRGASESARVNTVMVLIKLGVLLMFVVIGLTAWNGDHFDGFWDKGAAGISAAAATIFFSFIGLDAVSTAGEEVRDPQKALPRAIMGALAVVVTVYVLVAIAGLSAQPASEFSSPEQQDAGLSVILENVTGHAGLGHGARGRRGDLDLLGDVGDPLRPDPDPLRDRPRRDAAGEVLVGEPAHPHPDLQHHRRRDRGRADRRLRAGRLPVGHGVDRHPDGVHRRGAGRAGAAAYAARPRAAVPGPALPDHPAADDRGLHLHPVRPGGRDLGDLRVLAAGGAGVLLPVGPAARGAQPRRRRRHRGPR